MADEKPELSKLGKIAGRTSRNAAGAIAGASIASLFTDDPASAVIAGAAASTAAGSLTKEAINQMARQITGGDKGDAEFEEFKTHLSNCLSQQHGYRLDGFAGLDLDSPEKLQKFSKTYHALHSQVAGFEDQFKREVLMRALAHSAMKDFDKQGLPNSDTMIAFMKKTKELTPRQIAVLSLVSQDKIDVWAQPPIGFEDEDRADLNERVRFQEMHSLMNQGLVNHRRTRRLRSNPDQELTVNNWQDINPSRLQLTRDGKDFCHVMQLDKANPEYCQGVLTQISPFGRDVDKMREQARQKPSPGFELE